MTLEDIKKALYKENPKAKLLYIDKEFVAYASEKIAIDTEEKIHTILFRVPLTDIGDAKFYSEMEAKHLIRYMNTL